MISILLAIICAFAACHQDLSIVEELPNCSSESSFDSLYVKVAIVGAWEWKALGCEPWHETINKNRYDGLTIEFESDYTLLVKEDGVLIQTSRWEVVDGDANWYALNVSPSVGQLSGRIHVCQERLSFSDSYRDGCDNFFRRLP